MDLLSDWPGVFDEVFKNLRWGPEPVFALVPGSLLSSWGVVVLRGLSGFASLPRFQWYQSYHGGSGSGVTSALLLILTFVGLFIMAGIGRGPGFAAYV